jgi:molybdopterin-biosynthesis enzyme MoeA-like protein
MQKKQKFHNASAAAIANILTFSRGLLALNEAKALSFRRVSVESLSRRPGGPFVDIDPRALAILHEWLKGTGAEMTEARLRMTRIPNGAELILNKVSGAPGFWIGNVIVMAGVPSIMQAMLDEVVPKLKVGVRMLSETVRADAREGDIGMQLGEIAKANPAVAIGSYPFFDPQHGPNTNVVLRARDAQKLALAKRAVEDMLERVRRAQSKSRLSLALSRRKQGFESPRERQ